MRLCQFARVGRWHLSTEASHPPPPTPHLLPAWQQKLSGSVSIPFQTPCWNPTSSTALWGTSEVLPASGSWGFVCKLWQVDTGGYAIPNWLIVQGDTHVTQLVALHVVNTRTKRDNEGAFLEVISRGGLCCPCWDHNSVLGFTYGALQRKMGKLAARSTWELPSLPAMHKCQTVNICIFYEIALYCGRTPTPHLPGEAEWKILGWGFFHVSSFV